MVGLQTMEDPQISLEVLVETIKVKKGVKAVEAIGF
jgi:hypothetical protein